jgi:hypothetical protein
MAKAAKTIAQNYPRVQDEHREDIGCLDDSRVVSHPSRISVDELKILIRAAIENANSKSSREIISIPVGATSEQVEKIYQKKGKELFSYFRKYPGVTLVLSYSEIEPYRRNV